MKAIVPINVTALRVSAADARDITVNFKGRTANFDNQLDNFNYSGGITGEAVIQPLESEQPPLSPLGPGIHLHWELPEYFKKGVQNPDSKEVKFPQAPNRWFITRYLTRMNRSGNWLSPESHCWLVESDFISETPVTDSVGILRPSVPIPVPEDPLYHNTPYRYMGRVIDSSNPYRGNGSYLRDLTDAEGNPYYLDATGFVGPAFSSYYPDCCSVFGFWDCFADDDYIYELINRDNPEPFKVSYHVVGWIENGEDPFQNIQEVIRQVYESYVNECRNAGTGIIKTPADFFTEYSESTFGWQFNEENFSYRLNSSQNIEMLDLPNGVICNGIIQEIQWGLTAGQGIPNFLNNSGDPENPAILKDNNIKLSIGNTYTEALAALLKSDSENSEDSYEYMLNLLQSGLIENIDNGDHIISKIKKSLHSDGFYSRQGGVVWFVKHKTGNDNNVNNISVKESELPLSLARLLSSLNRSQKEYDMNRQALIIERKQLYMDWSRYINMLLKSAPRNTNIGNVRNFIEHSLENITAKDASIGILSYILNEDGSVCGINRSSVGTKAYEVWSNFSRFSEELSAYPDWEIMVVPAPAYKLPTEPVLAMETTLLDGKKRNGDSSLIFVRTTKEIIEIINLKSDLSRCQLQAMDLFGLSQVSLFTDSGYGYEIQQLLWEANILMQCSAGEVVSQLNNIMQFTFDPGELESFLFLYRQLLGGQNPLEASGSQGLFELIREDGYFHNINPERYMDFNGTKLGIYFTSRNGRGILPHKIGWSRQEVQEIIGDRFDPFIPAFITWKLKYYYMKRDIDRNIYGPENITRSFFFEEDDIDYKYEYFPNGGEYVIYEGSSLIIKDSIKSVTKKLEKYSGENEDPTQIKEYEQRKIFSATLNGFNANQVLRDIIHPLPVNNFQQGSSDTITHSIKNAASNQYNLGDNWYDDGFNNERPIYNGELAELNFGPLRSGLLSVMDLEIIDIFGQRMKLSTPGRYPSGPLNLIPSNSLTPLNNNIEDTAYLPPRLLMPARLNFKWLNSYNTDTEFIEMGPDSLSFPVFGWVMPNNLDNSLFFYDSDGNAIGSFGIEHGNMVYRTKVGNNSNPGDSLEMDIGTINNPKINSYLVKFMWYINNKGGTGTNTGLFLSSLLQAIRNSDKLTAPGRNDHNASLALLTGRPLALVRAVLGIETSGYLTPLNQADLNSNSPWTQDITGMRVNYTDRMETSSGDLKDVEIPVKLGETKNMEDGLIGYLKEYDNSADLYRDKVFYAFGATANNGVVHPSDTNIKLNLNAGLQKFTMLVEPHTMLHATTGLLPVETLSLPLNHYAKNINKLQMTFFTHPLLLTNNELNIKVPEQNGYAWGWINQRSDQKQEVTANNYNDTFWGYSPQTLEEGWLMLTPKSDNNETE